MAIDLMDRLLTDVGQDVFVEDAKDLGQCALPPFLQAQSAKVDPLLEDRVECPIVGEAHSKPLLLALLARVTSLRDVRSRCISPLTRVSQTDLRVAAEGHALLLAFPAIPEMPDLAALGGNVEEQAVDVGEGVVPACGTSMPNSHFR